ncbi:hypothetical protein NDU88_009824 [Pleurodeles waltl]|uniref:Uncharacterized protein n=1 Tax=Pleurodeles waltl TaxID=8319 RepID=A0AAV7QW49_PLEWA|nr:hypothetical protein NDU88_009824 [Pleurodeles waltl]
MREGVILATALRFWDCRHCEIQSGGAAGKTGTGRRTDSLYVSVEQFGGTSGRTVSAVVFGWFAIAPKTAKPIKAPRYSRGNPDTATGVDVRDRKQPPFSEMNRISEYRMRGQNGLLVEKKPLQVLGPLQDVGRKDESVEDVGPQIPEMFKQLTRTRGWTPQLPGNEGVQDAQNLAQDWITQDRITSAAGTTQNQEGTGTTLLLDDLVDLGGSDSQPLQVSQPVDIPQVVVAEEVALRGEAGSSHLIQQDTLHEAIKWGRKATPAVKKTSLTASRG